MHKCPHCPRSFKRSGHLNRHIRLHLNKRPFKCPYADCDKDYPRNDHLQRHIFSAHDVSSRPFECTKDACGKKFATKQKLERHVSLHERPTPYKCDHCNESFRKKNQLAVHVAKHTGELPYKCTEEGCESAFITPSKLRRHQLTHSFGEKTYVCCLCTEEDTVTFTKFSELTKHIRNIHPDPPRECDECGKRFRSLKSLKTHMRSHQVTMADRMLYSCDFNGCDARYVQRSGLLAHTKAKHTRVSQFACEICSFRSSYKSSLRKHINLKHSTNNNDDGTARSAKNISNVGSTNSDAEIENINCRPLKRSRIDPERIQSTGIQTQDVSVQKVMEENMRTEHHESLELMRPRLTSDTGNNTEVEHTENGEDNAHDGEEVDSNKLQTEANNHGFSVSTQSFSDLVRGSLPPVILQPLVVTEVK